MGYEIGTGELVNKKWALRIWRIQRSLLTVTRVATSVTNRELILNSIVLPSILLSAIVFWHTALGGAGATQFKQAGFVGACDDNRKSCNRLTQMVVITSYIGVVHTERDQYH